MTHDTKMYTCPMHPEVRQSEPGRCPECGMNLVPSPHPSLQRGEGGRFEHDKHAGHSLQMFVRKFWVSLVLTIPVVLLNWKVIEFPQAQYVSLILGSIVFFYGGLIFLQGAVRELRGRVPGMMTLIGIAISAAYAFSVFETLRGSEHTLFWELTTLITIMLLGHYLEMRAVQGVQGALRELSKLLPDTAEVILHPHPASPLNSDVTSRVKGEEKEGNFPPLGGEGLPARRSLGVGGREGGETKIVHLSELKAGDLILVRPGGNVPADGEIIEGNSEVNESIVTGESRPVTKKSGDKVIAGTTNGDGSLQIRVSQIGEKTFLAGVMRLVAEAQASKSRLQILSDRAAFYLTIIALTVGAITFVSWILAGQGILTATERLVAVLVIACPHALGLAVPLVASISTSMAARRGFLVKQRLALEAARNIDVVLFDKTGTLTKGEFGVEEILSRDSSSRQIGTQNDRLLVLQLAASVNQYSEHLIAKAVVAEAKLQNIELLEVKNFQRIPGKGAKAVINGEEVIVGSEAILDNLTPSLSSRGEGAGRQGRTVIYIVKNKELLGSISLADVIREESREAVKILKSLGLKTAMITGDAEDVAEWVAKELGIDEYFARVMPEQKAEKVKVLQSRGLQVAFVGDGINDAPALTQADLGIAIGAGTNVAIESAGIILVKNDPRDIVKIIRLSRLTYAKMKQNLFWATGYNVIALPLAAGALAGQGIVLAPAVGALLMSLSTVIVAVNALLLRRKRL